MNIEQKLEALKKALEYITHHNEAFIQWTFLGILVLSALVLLRSVLAKKTDEGFTTAGSGQSAMNGDMEAFLQKILEQTSKLEKVQINKADPEAVGQMDKDVQELKALLASREAEISQLKAGGQAQPSADADKLSARIKELESRLAEYEILEDDIADLSLFKEENVRLKGELEKLRSGGGPSPESDSGSVAPAAVESKPEASGAVVDLGASAPPDIASIGEDIVAEFAHAVNQEIPGAMAGADPAPAASLPDTGDPLADFAASLEMENKDSVAAAPEKPVAPPASPPPASAEAPAQPKVEVAAESKVDNMPDLTQAESDDLFAEFAKGESEAQAGEENDSSLDTAKMMEEMAALTSVAPLEGASALDEHIDTDKMALEATNFGKS